MLSLARKQLAKQEDFMATMQSIEALVSRAELDALIDQAVEQIRSICAGKRAAFAWSGGKDSITLEGLCRRAGITEGVCVLSNLEYPAYLEWLRDQKPVGVSIVNTGQDLIWLARNPHMLFPQESQTLSRWFQIVQHRGQNRYARQQRLDILLFGRRRMDGNYVGENGANIYEAHG